MGTLVTVETLSETAEAMRAIDRAFHWFRDIEARCTRFDPESELMQLTARAGAPVVVSPILFEAVRFAVAVAENTGGAFDPVIGRRMEAAGFNCEYSTRRAVSSGIADAPDISYRDVRFDALRQTIALDRPLVLDLGAVAKGLAIDVAVRELLPFHDFAIDAGGDLYLAGRNRDGAPWAVAIRHPRRDGEVVETFRVSDQAVCTSGDYERGEHILDARTGRPAIGVASATVIAPNAMLADAAATAAFILGPDQGIEFMEQNGAEGMIVTPEMRVLKSRGLAKYV